MLLNDKYCNVNTVPVNTVLCAKFNEQGNVNDTTILDSTVVTCACNEVYILVACVGNTVLSAVGSLGVQRLILIYGCGSRYAVV